jgi:hypothetical protein
MCLSCWQLCRTSSLLIQGWYQHYCLDRPLLVWLGLIIIIISGQTLVALLVLMLSAHQTHTFVRCESSAAVYLAMIRSR